MATRTDADPAATLASNWFLIQTVAGMRDKIYLSTFLFGAGLLLYVGRDLLEKSAVVTWGLTFGGTTAAAVLGLALYRVQFELRASRHELARKEAELNFALEVQQALFPRRFPPPDTGLEFAAVCVPARGISGDYYDVMQLGTSRVVFAIADISGKGISAAILMSGLQAVSRTLAEAGLSPAEVCSRLNLYLYRITDRSRVESLRTASELRERRASGAHRHRIELRPGACRGWTCARHLLGRRVRGRKRRASDR